MGAVSVRAGARIAHWIAEAVPTSVLTFDDLVVPHFPATHQLARWMTGNEHDAEDVVQETWMRAHRPQHVFELSRARRALRDALRDEMNTSRAYGEPAA